MSLSTPPSASVGSLSLSSSEQFNDFRFPFASAPDIIRSNQKDVYFQSVVFEQLSNILRRFYGARFIHSYTSEVRTFTELLYLTCTTLTGNRTLGEEYCDLIQVENDTLQLPSLLHRSGYILSTVVLPYLLSKLLPSFRNRARLKLETSISDHSNYSSSPTSAFMHRLKLYLLENISTVTSPSPLYALGLSIFYFSGSYYHIGKRLFGLRYIFPKRLAPSDERIGYEVLGVLLVLQMVVQGWLHVQETLRSASATPINAGHLAGRSTVIEVSHEAGSASHALGIENRALGEAIPQSHGVNQASIEKTINTPVLLEPRYALSDERTLGWIQGRQQRKCTLCLDELKDPSVTTCGHVFCWTCIADWIREKPECPLCRQGIMYQHVLPLRS